MPTMPTTEMCDPKILGDFVVCTRCGYSLPRSIVGDTFSKNCSKGEPVRYHRPRTEAEIRATYPICNTCPHQVKEATETLDAGICRLRAAQCAPCSTVESFIEFKKSGLPCDDGRFPGTPLVTNS